MLGTKEGDTYLCHHRTMEKQTSVKTLGFLCGPGDESRKEIWRFILVMDLTWAPFASLKKQAETLFRLICCERKTLFRLKKQAEKYGL